MITGPLQRGSFVKVWFDTGAGRTGGMKQLYGIVIAAGPVAFRVRWESGLTNRIRYAAPNGVEPCPEAELDKWARERLGLPAL